LRSLRGYGRLTIFHFVQLWQVYVFAFLFGSAAAFDAPVRQTRSARLSKACWPRRAAAVMGGRFMVLAVSC